MKERLFRFKEFSVRHRDSAMKVGVDGTLLGAWAGPPAIVSAGTGSEALTYGASILDVGCGCGLVGLMLAQRFPRARVLGIDIHEPSVAEMRFNASASPWGDRVAAEVTDFLSPQFSGTWDMVVSNPPFFDSGVSDPLTPREQARHGASLNPLTLMRKAVEVLAPGGRLAMVCPTEWLPRLQREAGPLALTLSRLTNVRGLPTAPEKRILSEWSLSPADTTDSAPVYSAPLVTHITLEESPGVPTPAYLSLCHPFYLKF